MRVDYNKHKLTEEPMSEPRARLPIQTVIVAGGGPAGIFTARALELQGIKATVLEKENVVGGKCHTFTDRQNPKLKTEFGAVFLTPNYTLPIEAALQHGVRFEAVVDNDEKTLPLMQKLKTMSWLEKLRYSGRFGYEVTRFTYKVHQYQSARNNTAPLPKDFELPFADFAQKHHFGEINAFLKPFVTGFGYGLMEHCPTYSVMEYMGLGTIPSLLLSATPIPYFNKRGVVSIHGGYQHLIESIAKPLHVVKGANIQTISRDPKGVTVKYCGSDNNTHDVKADALVLAIPPLQWKTLGMELSTTEQKVVDEMKYYRYPVAICKLQGVPAKFHFVPPAYEEKGIGMLALITTRDDRDNPEDGRLCTAYINLPAGKTPFVFNAEAKQQLTAELKQAGAEKVDIVDTKIWTDYHSTIPWATRLALEAQQMNPDNRTAYATTCAVGGFEDVRCAAEQATNMVNKHIARQPVSVFTAFKTGLLTTLSYFRAPVVAPVNNKQQTASVAEKKL